MNISAYAALKAAQADLAFSTEDEKNLSEIYALLSQPAVALPDPNKQDAGERYDAAALLKLICRWPEAHRFPCQSNFVLCISIR